MSDTSPYRIKVYAAHPETFEREPVSLSPNRKDYDWLDVETLWEAVTAIATLPATGWLHWEESKSEAINIRWIELEHIERRRNIASVHVLETIDRAREWWKEES